MSPTKEQCMALLDKPLNWGERRLVERVLHALENPLCGHCKRGEPPITLDEQNDLARTSRGYGVNL